MTDISNLSNEELQKRVNWYEKKYGPYIEKRGIHNWKNLFRRPTIHEWTILLMIIMALFMGWAYQHDVEICQSYLYNQSLENYKILNNFNLSINISDIPIQRGNLTGVNDTME